MQRPRDFLRVLTQCVKTGRIDVSQGELLVSYSGMTHLMSDYRDSTRGDVRSNSLAAYLLEELRGSAKPEESGDVKPLIPTRRIEPPLLRQEVRAEMDVARSPSAIQFQGAETGLPGAFNALVTGLTQAGMSVKKKPTSGVAAEFAPLIGGDLTELSGLEDLARGTVKGRFASRIPQLPIA